MTRTLIIIIASLLSPFCLFGQNVQNEEQAKQALEDAAGTTKKYKFFDGLSAGVDLVGPIMYQFAGYGDYQAFVQANIKGKYLPIVEIGYGRANKTYDVTDITYKAKAPFGRIGCDINLLKNKHDDYRATLGLRYGFTSFEFDTTNPIVTTDESDVTRTTYSTSTDKCTLHWAELVLGVDAKIWGPIHMGWSVRYRRRLSASQHSVTSVDDANSEPIVNEPLYAPGFGNASETTCFMALYTVNIEI